MESRVADRSLPSSLFSTDHTRAARRTNNVQYHQAVFLVPPSKSLSPAVFVIVNVWRIMEEELVRETVRGVAGRGGCGWAVHKGGLVRTQGT